MNNEYYCNRVVGSCAWVVRIQRHIELQEFAEDTQVGLEGVELLDDNDIGFQVRTLGGKSFENTYFPNVQGLLL